MLRPLLLSLGICLVSCANATIDEELEPENDEEQQSTEDDSGPGGSPGQIATGGMSPSNGGDGDLLYEPTGGTGSEGASGGSSSASGGAEATGGSDSGGSDAGGGTGSTASMNDCGATVPWEPNSQCMIMVGTLVTFEGAVYSSLYSHSYCNSDCPPGGGAEWCPGQQEYQLEADCAP